MTPPRPRALGGMRWTRGRLGPVVGPILTIVIASFIISVALAAAPGDPVAQLLGGRATPERYEAVRHELGLDRSVPERYVDWLGGVVRGDLGHPSSTAAASPRCSGRGSA